MEDFRKILAARLGRQQKDGGAHPEVDILTAFMEARLGDGERKSIVAHLAVCAECRHVVALAAGNVNAPAPAKEVAGRWWNLSWAAALAAACVVGVVVWHSNSVVPPVVEKAVAKPVQPAASVVTAETPNRERPQATAVHSSVVAKGMTERNFTMPMAGSGLTRMPEVPPELLPDGPPKTDEIALASGTMATPPTAPPPAQAMAFHNSRGILAKAFGRLPHSESAWGIASSNGILEKSDDGGKTWRSVPIDSRTNFLAISALGSDIWVGGEDGALFHSTDDGANWKKVPVTDGEERLRESITGVETQGSRVRVSMKSAKWISTDGGATWRKEE